MNAKRTISILQEARERKGISLEQAESDTNIRKQYLIALEEGNYDQLPGRVYSIGFLRSYGKYLGLDPEPLIQEFKHNYQDEVAEIIEVESNKETERTVMAVKRGQSMIRMTGYGLAIVTLAGLFYIPSLLSDDGANNQVSENRITTTKQDREANQEEALNGNSTIGEAIEKENSVQPEAQQIVTQEDGVNITIRIREDRSWIAVTEDGVPRYQGIMHAGETMTFNGKEKVFLHVGNAGAVEIIYNGENLGLMGRWKDVEKKEFVRS
ncbi:helix-turn-helix domain-containing protein [Heliorestis acidaminivorans]|uniref:Helix-turn-helix domain-containing protein n=1 Tax=Heliorestis acidaminivorans TaxID=553427 RepID=A0A6I0F2X2_9FIRM|nr:RodZ domain-containing protein [Heliorestis acidaminivorans]KAB2954331.1 helix-turn-helix domain-containing protein [Heliorestis acidaminivorans]